MFKKLFINFLILSSLIISFNSSASASSRWGKGELKLTDEVVMKFIEYIKGNVSRTPYLFAVSVDGLGYNYYYCESGGGCAGGDEQILEECSRYSNGAQCKLFAKKRTIRWQNDINPGKGKTSKINSKWSEAEIRAKLNELGFIGTIDKDLSSITFPTDSITYETKGERSIAMSWEGYEELIAGTIKFDEVDYKGSINISLPNGDGNCDGNYILQKNGSGTWNLSCTNNMGAAGTLKWKENGGVTGKGRDFDDRKVKFTVSKES